MCRFPKFLPSSWLQLFEKLAEGANVIDAVSAIESEVAALGIKGDAVANLNRHTLAAVGSNNEVTAALTRAAEISR